MEPCSPLEESPSSDSSTSPGSSSDVPIVDDVQITKDSSGRPNTGASSE